jgi:chemotaxis protein MotA
MFSTLLGISMFLGTLYYVMFFSHGEKFTGFYNQSALILLILGPIAVILISRSIGELFNAVRSAILMSFVNEDKEMTRIANTLAILGRDVSQKGMGALAQNKSSVKNPLFRDGIAMILNSFTAEEIRHNLMAKTNIEHMRLVAASEVLEALGKISPAMGLLGTLVGLVQMLANLSDPSSIGPGMAVSLLATLYGLIGANAIYIPLADKVSSHSEKILQLNTMVMEGVLLLKERKSSAHLRDVVNTYTTGPKAQRNATTESAG